MASSSPLHTTTAAPRKSSELNSAAGFSGSANRLNAASAVSLVSPAPFVSRSTHPALLRPKSMSLSCRAVEKAGQRGSGGAAERNANNGGQK